LHKSVFFAVECIGWCCAVAWCDSWMLPTVTKLCGLRRK